MMFSAFVLGIAMSGQDERPVTVEKWMATRWTEEAAAGHGWKEYPRPQMVRDEWVNLNGMWEYAITDKATASWGGAQGEIRVPYPIQSKLSGVQKHVYDDQALWYRRSVEVPADWNGQRVVLHFGAVDWEATVFVNGQEVGKHYGGYAPFSYDITDYLKSGANELTLRAWDPTNEGDQPIGKQTFNPHGIWYTAVTGIWQTVWMEPVPESSLSAVSTVTKVDGSVTFSTTHSGQGGDVLRVSVYDEGHLVAQGEGAAGQPLAVKVPDVKLWSPDSPFLYDADVELVRGGATIDKVETYFGVREIEVIHDEYGPRTYLNKEPVFMFGPLDQGWWPDGLYTPPTEDALRYDLEYTKRAGFNTVRKHVKTEPAEFYRYCDEIGLLVWQDMPSSLKFGPRWIMDWRVDNPTPDGVRPQDSKDRFLAEWKEIMDYGRPFTSLVMWVPFNEAWGQFDTAKVTEWTKEYDPSRLVNSASGGNFVPGAGDVLDIHAYPGPASPGPLKTLVPILGEFGGLGLPLEGHTWQARDNWGYQSFTNVPDLMERYEQLINDLVFLKETGLSGAIYTQTTDVEIEINGLLTYDRTVSKMPVHWLRRVNSRVYQPPVKLEPVLVTSETEAQTWRYRFGAAPDGWSAVGFNDLAWQQGPGGFGTAETPGAVVRTVWNTEEIVIRRTFQVSDPSGDLVLKLHHDEDVEVYINGVLVLNRAGYATGYVFADIADGVLRQGENVIAVRCKQTRGGQYVDVGVYRKASR